jgi:hypothetical protein
LKWLPLRSSHFQRKNIFDFGVQESLRTFLNPFFHRGREEKRHLPVIASPVKKLLGKIRRFSRAANIKYNSLNYAQSKAERILNRPGARALIPQIPDRWAG